MVYRSDKPKLWDRPDTKASMAKLQNAIADLDGIGAMIEKQRWTQISQTLGASREDRARFERAGKIVEQRATILSRQMKGM